MSETTAPVPVIPRNLSTFSSRKQEEPKGKRGHPDYVQANAYVPKRLRKAVEKALLDMDGLDYSALVTDLLSKWLKNPGRSESLLGPMYGKTGIYDRIAIEMNRGAKHDMTITIRLSDEEQRRLAERAARNGRDVADYVHLLIERDIQGPAAVDQALAPFRRQVEESGMTEDELGDFFEGVREEVWQEKHGRPSKTS